MKVTKEQYQEAKRTIALYAEQLQDELNEVKRAAARSVGIDSDYEITQLPKRGDIIEITEAYGTSEKTYIGSQHKVVSVYSNIKGPIVKLAGNIYLKTHLYKFKVINKTK
jgi:hypothetical protein